MSKHLKIFLRSRWPLFKVLTTILVIVCESDSTILVIPSKSSNKNVGDSIDVLTFVFTVRCESVYTLLLVYYVSIKCHRWRSNWSVDYMVYDSLWMFTIGFLYNLEVFAICWKFHVDVLSTVLMIRFFVRVLYTC